MILKFVGKVLELIFNNTRDFWGRHKLVRALGLLAIGAPVKSRYGVYLEAHIHDSTNRFALDQKYDEVVPGFVGNLSEGALFIDIGANQGLFSLLASKKVGPQGLVIAVEPQIDIANRLKRNLRLNGCDNVMVLPIALSSKSCFLSVGPANSGHSGGFGTLSHGPEKMLALDAGVIGDLIVGEIDRFHCAALKLDVEGNEYTILESLSSLLKHPKMQSVVVEIDSDKLSNLNKTPDDLYSFLGRIGFEGTATQHSSHFDEVFIKKVER